MNLTSAQESEVRRMMSYYPYRIIYGVQDKDTGEVTISAVTSMKIPNKLARQGHEVAIFKTGNGKGNKSLLNPSQIEQGMWVVEDTQGKPLGVYPTDYKEVAMQEIGQGFADQYKEHVIVMRKGEEFEHAHYFPKGKPTKNPKGDWGITSNYPYDAGRQFAQSANGVNYKPDRVSFLRMFKYWLKNLDDSAGTKEEKLKSFEDGFRANYSGSRRNEGRKKNPSTIADAKALAEKWHGRPADEIFEVVEKEVYDTNLAVLGELVEMTLMDDDGYGQVLSFDKTVLLVGTVDENNMEFVGGDQSLPLDKLGVETKKHKVNLGQVFSIAYYTDKHHLQGEPKKAIEREHEFNEESKDGNFPELVYDTRNNHMELVGGSYIVTPEGIRD